VSVRGKNSEGVWIERFQAYSTAMDNHWGGRGRDRRGGHVHESEFIGGVYRRGGWVKSLVASTPLEKGGNKDLGRRKKGVLSFISREFVVPALVGDLVSFQVPGK